MAIYHLHVKVIGRKAGSSAVASAAYRSGSRLRDERLGRDQDLSAKRGVIHSEVMLPENAPERLSDRERLWNEVEAFEEVRCRRAPLLQALAARDTRAHHDRCLPLHRFSAGDAASFGPADVTEQVQERIGPDGKVERVTVSDHHEAPRKGR